MKITQYAAAVGACLTAAYNPKLRGGTWQAKFESCEVMKDECFLLGEWGGGRTPDEAIKSYAQAIAGKRIVFNARGKDRREFDVPEDLTH